MAASLDLAADVPPLYSYTFLRATGSDAVLTGAFYDHNGLQVSAMQTFTISNAQAGYTLTALYNTANNLAAATLLPLQFVGFVGKLATSAVYVGNGGKPDGTIPDGSNSTIDMRPASGYPQRAISNQVAFGRVNAAFLGGI